MKLRNLMCSMLTARSSGWCPIYRGVSALGFAIRLGAEGLFVRDQFAHVGDVLLEFGDFFGPGAVCVIGVGDSGGVLPFGFG